MRWCGHPLLGRCCLIAALVLTLPSLSDQWVFDDHVLALNARGDGEVAGLRTGPLGELFTFTTGHPDQTRALMAEGALMPWWSDEHHKNAFLRPLSSLSHRLDFYLWPHSAFLMHVHSWLWFAVLLLVAQVHYRALNGRTPTIHPLFLSLPFVIFALDESHGATLSWISNRNALIATACALHGVTQHHRFCEGQSRRAGWLGPLWFALGIAGGEMATCMLGYLLAHALLLEQDSYRKRLVRLLPYGLLIALWRVAYRVFELGSHGSDGYHDPLREPLAYTLGLLRNLPILLGAQFSVPYADLAFWGPPTAVPWLWSLSLLVLAGSLVLLWPALRSQRQARYYALGTALSALPVCASVPGQRLLLPLSIGAAGLLAHGAATLYRELQARPKARLPQLALLLILAVHIPAAAIALPFSARSMTWVGGWVDGTAASLPRAPGTTGQTWVIICTPFNIMASYLQAQRAHLDQPRPAHLYWLATASSTTTVRRIGPRSVLVESERGFLYTPQERHYRRNPTPLAAGSPTALVRLPQLTAEVLASSPDGRPTQVRFEFPVPLEDSSLAFFTYRNGHYEPWNLQPARFSAADFFDGLATHVATSD